MNLLKNASASEKRAIVWSDLDVPVEEGKVVDNTRLQVSTQTIKFLLGKGSKVLLIGHLGRPEGRDQDFSLKPVAEEFEKLLSRPVELLSEITQPFTDLALLENIRFWPEEEEKKESFAQKISGLGDFYVNDCFSTSHHAGATMLFLPKLLPAYCGLALEKEVTELAQILKNPKRPLLAILAGAKLETKLPAILNMSKIADKVLVAGKLMFAFKEKLPNIVVASDDVDGADIGPASIKRFKEEIALAATIVWNGTMGRYEDPRYLEGTKEIAQAVAASGSYTIVGGGDTVAVLHELGYLTRFNHVSMGGGAMLEFLAGKRLAGLATIGYYNG